MQRSSLSRTPMRRRYRDTGPDSATVNAVLLRDGWKCIRSAYVSPT